MYSKFPNAIKLRYGRNLTRLDGDLQDDEHDGVDGGISVNVDTLGRLFEQSSQMRR